MKLLVHWVGGKSRIVDNLKSLMPEEYGDYYEPFLGSGALAFSLSSDKRKYLSDINNRLITMYEEVRDHPTDVIDYISNLVNTKEEYYRVRDIFNTSKDVIEIAACFIYLNKRGFNGLYRENSNGLFNVPYGKAKGDIDFSAIFDMSGVLSNPNTYIEHKPYSDITPKSGDFVYIDPPYVGTFASYTKESFDHEKLKKFIDKLTNNGVMVMFSNSIHAEELYKDYNIYHVEVGRQVNSDPTKRGKVVEIIGTNY
jgi:DNA adenine methylase|nr:MAG TPA: adenine-specific methyltransferase [Caudoviricetes sp.]